MKEGKHEKSKFRIVEKYSVLILIATLLMSIGYAEMSGINLSVAANVKAAVQDGVFITEVTRTAYEGADITNSKINSYAETTMNSTVVLGSESGSTISYNVWLYNNSDKDHVFIDVIKDEMAYKNTNITYSTDLVPYETVIGAGQNIDFNITFSYAGSDVSNNTLNSVLNFRFMEIPKLELSNAEAITNIYPGASQEKTFTVTNFNSSGINGVPLDYTLVAEIYDESGNKITEPITATICNESGTAVTGSVSMTGDSATKTTHTYKLKLEWDASKNSADYAGKTYSYKIKVVATPNATATESKYADYTLTKETTANITTAPFYFVTDPTSVETTTIEMADNKAAINLTVSNNNGTNYNIFETTYTISLDNTDFTLWVDGTEYANNVTNARQLGKGSLTNMVDPISLVPKTTSTTLTKEEICNLTITTTSPYVKTETIKIIATDKTNPTAPTITGGSEGTYATSQTVSVSKEATDVGTGVKYYQYLIDSDGQSLATTETGNVGSTATAKSKKFSTNYDGYYVYFRAVDAVGNVSDWSNEQRLYIDTKAPKVTVKSEDVAEIEPGTSVDLEEYFTISKNGTAPYTITWTNQTTGDTISNKQYTFEEEGTYQITCKVTKENGLSASATKTLQVESAGPFTAVDVANAPTKFYGADIMNYDSYGDPNVGWKVFHSDEENIYLIADDYIHYDYAPTSENYTLTNYSDYEIGFGDLYNDYSGSSSILDAEITDSRVLKWIEYVNDYQASEEVNIKAVSFMLDTRKWNILYRNYTYADYAIGGPTLKMFVDSYNARYPGDNIRISYDSVGYFVGFEGASQGGSITVTAISVDDLFFLDETRTEGMWLAGPSSSSANFVFTASSNGRILSFNARTRKYCGFRPVVCLKSGVTLEKVGNGQYNLVEPPAPALPEEETELVVGSVSGSFNCEDDTLTSEDISVNIPSGVNVVKLSIVGGVSGTGLGTMIWVRNVSSGTTWNDTYRRVYDGTFELERFVGVTPEKNYSIRISVYDEDLIDTFGSINFEYRITYSKSINAVTPDKEDL